MKSSPTSPDQNNAAVTERQRAEELLRQSEDRLQQAIRVSQTGIFDHDHIADTIYWSPRYREIYGCGPDEPATLQNFLACVHPEDLERIKAGVSLAHDPAGNGAFDVEHRIIRRDGKTRWISTRSRTFFEGEGDARHPTRTVGATLDITERKQAQLSLNHTLRAYRVLSHCNEALTRITNEKKLLREFCRIAVKDGAYYFAWVGYPQHDAVKTVLPMAKAGYEAGYLKNLITWAEDDKRGQGPIGRVIRTKEKVVVRNFAKDPTLKPWHKAARERGYASGVALPLLHNNEILGAIIIYATEEDAFNDEEVKLLEELAHNLALGVYMIRISNKHKKAEQELQQSEERYRVIYENNPSMYFTVNSSGVILSVNAFGASQLGYGVEELIGKPVQMIFHSEEREKVGKHLHDCLTQAGKLYEWEIRKIHKTGRVMWVKESARSIVTPDGIKVLIVCRDITDRKQAEDTLREQHLALINAMPGISRVDPAGRYFSVNAAYAAMLGYTPAELIGSDSSITVYREDLPLARTACDRMLREGKCEFEARAVRKDGSLFYKHVLMVKITGADNQYTGHHCFMRDITEHKQAEEKIAQYMKHLKTLSARLVAIREEERRALARELHDEIGQNLTAAKIHLHALEQACQLCGIPHAENLHEALLAVTKTLEQVRSLSLDLHPMQLDDLSLPVALRSLLARAAAAAGWNTHFDEDLRPGHLAPALELACYRVAQEALTNVLRHAGATEVWVTLRQSDQTLHLTVRDNGGGFDLASVQSTADSPSLGLISMEERVRNAAGQLTIRAQPGEGTEVEAVFPIVAANEEILPSPEAHG